MVAALERYFAGPDPSVLSSFYDALCAVDISTVPKLTKYVYLLATNSNVSWSFVATTLRTFVVSVIYWDILDVLFFNRSVDYSDSLRPGHSLKCLCWAVFCSHRISTFSIIAVCI